MLRGASGSRAPVGLRHASSGGGGGGGAIKAAAATLLLTGGGLGGAVAYASVDDDFRKLLEESVPGSDQVLELLIGAPAPPPPPPPKPAVSKLKIPSSVVVTKPKVEKTEEALPPAPPSPPLEPPAPEIAPPHAVEATVVETPIAAKAAVEIPPAVETSPVVETAAQDIVKPEAASAEAIVEPTSVESEKVPEPPIISQEQPQPVQASEPVKAVEPALKEEEKSVEAPMPPMPPMEPLKVPEPELIPPPEPAAAPVVEVPVEVPVEEIKPEAVVEAVAEPVETAPTVPEPAAESVPEPVVEPVAEPVVEPVAESVPETAPEASVPVEVAPAFAISPDIDNSSLETVLEELTKEMKTTVDNAVSGYEVSSDAVLNHINIMQKVLESNLTVKDDAAWNEMFEAAVAKSDATKAAEIKEREAIAAIDNVIESIAAGRKNRTTSTNPALLVAEEEANRAIYQLEQAKVKGTAIQGEAKVMEEYRELVEAGKQQFQKEMASIMPDVKLGEQSGKLTEDELNMFITHAYRKVLFLQQELAKQQTLEQERFKKALEKQRLETQMVATEKIESELERQKRDLELEHERRMAVIRDEAEGEMRAQLRRQAAAHSDHLADVLSVQAAELTRKNDHILDEKLSAAKSEYLTSLSALSGTVNGLTEALTARSSADKASLRAQGLWLACTGLVASLGKGNSKADTWEGRLLPLAPDLKSIEGAAGEEDAFVKTVVGSVSKVAMERGVYTEDSLKERWAAVERVARKVAAIGDQGGSLLSYGLSYLQSVLLVDLTTRAPCEGEAAIDPASLSSIDLVNLARHSLDRGNLARAVQYVTLLRGESGRVARDWLEEARLTLEARQAAEALVAHAASQGIAALPSP